MKPRKWTKEQQRVFDCAMKWYHWLTGGRGARMLPHFASHREIHELAKACAAARKHKGRE